MTLLNWGLFGLFCGTFLTATIIPFPSDVLVIGAYKLDYSIQNILIVATIGNFLGTLTNYWIGFKSSKAVKGSEKLKKRFKLTDKKMLKWEKRLAKWGVLLGFLAWIPIIGEPMVAILGFFRVKLFPLTITIIIGVFLRYFLLLYFYLGGF